VSLAPTIALTDGHILCAYLSWLWARRTYGDADVGCSAGGRRATQ